MKIFKVLSVLGVLGLVSACGSSSGTASTGVAGLYGSPIGNQAGYVYGSTAIPGGSKSMTTILSGSVMMNGYSFQVSPTVQAGDQIIIMASGGVNTHNGWVTTPLTNVSLTLNGVMVASSLYGQFTMPTSGVLTIGADWQTSNSSGSNNVTFPYNGGVAIAHCTSTAGAAMPCP